MTRPDPLDESVLASFTDGFRGDVFQPDNERYDDARTVWNAAVERAPAFVARCTGTADVITALNVAREHDLPLAVRATGHNVAGTAICDGGVVIDIRSIDGVRVDPKAKAARVQPGATWGDLDHETQAFGLATPGAQAPSVGVIGATLGGGIGWLSREYGLTVDNVLSADVVTAEGELVRASADENPDLFWGLRGGSGNFGIVTSLELRLHEIGTQVLAGSLLYPLGEATAVLRQYRDWMADAPKEVSSLVSVLELPSAPHIPPERRGTRAVMIGVCYTGDPERGDAMLAPLRGSADPFVDTIRQRPYVEWQQAGKSDTILRTYQTSHYFERLSDRLIDAYVEWVTDAPSSGAAAYFLPHDGAVTDVPSDATAYPHRNVSYLLVIEARWEDSERDDRHITWAQEGFETLRPYATGGMWVNALTEHRNQDYITAAYGDNYDRLVATKSRWDPDNRFRTNHNIEPQE